MKNNLKKMSPFLVVAGIALLYLVLYFTDYILFQKSIENFRVLLFQIAPILLVVFVLMFIVFWFINPAKIKKYLGGQSGLKGYLVAIVIGIISVGPVYIWYPFLKDLQKNGMSDKLIAVFIYNRSIKLALLPMMILYFGLKFTFALTILTVVFSLVIGAIVEKFTSVK